VAAVPTAAAGLNDWSDTARPQTRVGLVHAALNTTALSLYLASLVARARGTEARRPGAGLAGLGVLLGGGYLGGHLCFVLGVEVNRTAWEQPPQQWTPVLADTELADGELCRADAGGVPVLLYRTDGTVYALASTCTHMGGPLQEGTISDGCVTCPWPGSTFRFADGSIMRSPASTHEPSHQTRIQTGASRSAPSHRRCGPQPSARAVTEDTVLRAPNGPDRRGCPITERRFRARP